MSKYLRNTSTVIINPATSDKQGPSIYNEGYTRQLEDSNNTVIPSRGAMVEISSDIHAPMENQLKHDDIVQTITFGGSPDSILQIFRASEDNLHDVRPTLKGEGTITTFDNMEYSSDGAAQAVWVASDTVNTNVYSEATIKTQGSYSLKVRCRKNQSPGDTITRTFAAQDWSGYETIRFKRYNTVGNSKCIWKIRISDDGTDWYESQFTSVNANVWEELNVPIANMTLVGTGVNLASITRVQFYMVECISADHYFYVDQFEVISASGVAFFKLYNFGTNPTPTNISEGTLLTNDEGSTEIEISLPANKSIVNIHAHYGAHQRTTKLTVGNYYGMYFTGLTSGAMYIYGTSTQTYNSGKMYTGISGALTQTSKSMRFINFAVTDCILMHATFSFSGSVGDSVIYMPIKDYVNNQIMDNFLGTLNCSSQTTVEIDYSICDIPIYLTPDTPFRPLYVDDAGSSAVSSIYIRTHYAYKPIILYG